MSSNFFILSFYKLGEEMAFPTYVKRKIEEKRLLTAPLPKLLWEISLFRECQLKGTFVVKKQLSCWEDDVAVLSGNFAAESKLARNAPAFALLKKLHNNLNKGTSGMWSVTDFHWNGRGDENIVDFIFDSSVIQLPENGRGGGWLAVGFASASKPLCCTLDLEICKIRFNWSSSLSESGMNCKYPGCSILSMSNQKIWRR